MDRATLTRAWPSFEPITRQIELAPGLAAVDSAQRMIDPSKVVSIHPYFKVKPGNLARAKAALAEFVTKTSGESGNLYYDFTINRDTIFCREAYVGAEGLLIHVENIGAVLAEFLKLVDVARVEVHGSAQELAKLKAPLADLKPEWYELECGVRR
jgi:quinol monooxygenase YgiN